VNNNSIGLPAGVITTLSNGCKGYEPLLDVPFVPQKGNIFNPRLAEWSINACTYAYQNLCNQHDINFPPEVEEGKVLYWNEGGGFFSDPMITSGYIAKIKPIPGDPTNRIALIFRGTQRNREWVLDAHLNQNQLIMEPPGDLVKIHKGFWEIYTKSSKKIPSLQKQIQELLPIFLSKTAPNELHIGGHSMGSAIATLVFSDTVLSFPGIKINTYATGSPRVGNPAFANTLNTIANNSSYDFSFWRIANTEDIITTLPEPVFENLLYSHLLISDKTYPNTIDLISFTKNLGAIFDNHHLFNYYYAMKHLSTEL
jgi:hypothetical protein